MQRISGICGTNLIVPFAIWVQWRVIWKVWGRKRCMYVWLWLWAVHASRHLLSMFAYCPVWGILEVSYVFVGNGIPICQIVLVIFRTSNIRYWRFSYNICRSCKSWVDFGGRTDKRYTHLSSTQYLLSYIYLYLLCFLWIFDNVFHSHDTKRVISIYFMDRVSLTNNIKHVSTRS